MRAFGITLYDARVGANLSPDKASALVPAMERQMCERLATKHDLTVRLGTLLAVSIGLIVPLRKAF